MIGLYNAIFYEPLLNTLVWLYNVIPGHDIGIAIILLTIIIKLILYPLSRKSIQSQKAMQEIQPKVEEIKKMYKDEKEKQAQAMMKLYKDQKVNPMSSCFPLLIQFPFLIAVYQVFRTGLSNGSLDSLYSFVAHPGAMNPVAFGFLDLGEPMIALALLAGAAQYWQAKMMITKKPAVKDGGAKDESMTAMMNKQMTFMMPIITIFIGITLPGGLMLYWIVVTLLTVFQQKMIFRSIKKPEVEVVDSVPPQTPQTPQT